MSQLIQMRQRMKAIETIKKITHAMRIISMSLHGRLKQKELAISHYHSGIKALFSTLQLQYPDWKNPLIHADSNKNLVILIGSNKGLTGNFNTMLFKYFQANVSSTISTDYIAIGKKAADYLKNNKYNGIIAAHTQVSFATLFTISQEITRTIMQGNYGSVIVVSNMIKNFFVQKPRISGVLPTTSNGTTPSIDISEYHWEQNPLEILDALLPLTIKAELQYLIFESLLAEQAARFVSMDSSTRNAANLLDETKLQYNKLRQAKITQELTELTSSF